MFASNTTSGLIDISESSDAETQEGRKGVGWKIRVQRYETENGFGGATSTKRLATCRK